MIFSPQKRKAEGTQGSSGEGPVKKKFMSAKNVNGNIIKTSLPNAGNCAAANPLDNRRKSLPIYEVRENLMQYLKKHPTTILIGETGSGKSTQIPQFLHEDGLLCGGAALVTQPRRVAAISVATRVAQEMASPLGHQVGYSVRFEDQTSPATKLKFATDGMVLREAMLDPLLKRYSWLVLDEAHERSVCTDILFGVAKAAQTRRREAGKRPLRILVMSATMNAHKFSDYFDNCPILQAPGREHALGVHYLSNTPEDYVYTSMKTVMQIHKKAPINEGILVFLTGQDEIESAVKAMRKVMEKVDKKLIQPMKVVPLYGQLPQKTQMQALKRPSESERHVIFSTNIAETSLTIPGIRYVVDTGKAKIRSYSPINGIYVLKVRNISQAQAKQRAGRAGREADGSCYRTYSQAHFRTELAEARLPEILSTCLAGVVLQLLTVGIRNVRKFDFIDRPNKINLDAAVDELVLLEAVKKLEGDELELTEIGKKMSVFPVEPKHAKILIMSEKFECTEEALSVVAMLNTEQVLVTPGGAKRATARDTHARLHSPEGDLITLLLLYRAFNTYNRSKQWCHEHFLNFRNLTYAASVRKQLADLCERHGLPKSSCGPDTEPVKRCLLSGLFTQVAELQPGHKYLTVASREPARIHPSSGVRESRSDYVMFTQLVNTGTESYMHGVTRVEAQWLHDAAPEYFRRHVRTAALGPPR